MIGVVGIDDAHHRAGRFLVEEAGGGASAGVGGEVVVVEVEGELAVVADENNQAGFGWEILDILGGRTPVFFIFGGESPETACCEEEKENRERGDGRRGFFWPIEREGKQNQNRQKNRGGEECFFHEDRRAEYAPGDREQRRPDAEGQQREGLLSESGEAE